MKLDLTLLFVIERQKGNKESVKIPYWRGTYPNTSKYNPHQGSQECERRRNK